MSSQLEPDPKPRDIAYLDNYAMERWECLLHYMVGSTQQELVSGDAAFILHHANLMKRFLTPHANFVFQFEIFLGTKKTVQW